jgi:hypothetical protein
VVDADQPPLLVVEDYGPKATSRIVHVSWARTGAVALQAEPRRFAGPIRESDLTSGASGPFDPAIAGSGAARVSGSRLATSQAVGLAIVYASQLDPVAYDCRRLS